MRKNFLYKNQTIKKFPPPITFPGLVDQFSLCPIKTLKDYIAATNELPHNGHLFLHPTSGKPLTSGRLNYWLTRSISRFDESLKGKPHDLRKYAFSASWLMGTPIDEIVKDGLWTTANPFLQKYCTPMPSPLPLCIAGKKRIE